MVRVEYPKDFLMMHCEMPMYVISIRLNILDKNVGSPVFVYPNPNPIATPHHQNNAPTVASPSGTAPGHMGQLSTTPNTDPTLSTGLEI